MSNYLNFRSLPYINDVNDDVNCEQFRMNAIAIFGKVYLFYKVPNTKWMFFIFISFT